MNLSKNFTLEELVKSLTAMRLGITNKPQEHIINNLKILVDNILQPLRDHFNKFIFVSSGYRCPMLNEAVGGSLSSDHMRGLAVDIDQDNKGKITNRQIFDYIKDNMEFTQLIWEFGDKDNPGWVHVSYDPDNLKKEILKSIKYHGKIIYKNYK